MRPSTPRRLVCVALAAAAIPTAVAPPATAALPTKGRYYADDDEQQFFTVSRSGRKLSDITVQFETPCSNRRTGFLRGPPGDTPWRLRVARDGSFSGTIALALKDIIDEFTVSEEYWLSGRFIRRGKAARVVVRGRKVGEGGTVCDTGDRVFTLWRQPIGYH
jgi:hypothetical protein